MFNWSRTMEIVCDAPAYPIVVACKRIGLDRPEDVRWLKMDHYLNGQQRWSERLRRQPIKSLLGSAIPTRPPAPALPSCPCWKNARSRSTLVRKFPT